MTPIVLEGKSFRSKSTAGMYLIKQKNMSVKDAANTLGIHRMTLYQMFKKEVISARKIPNRVRMWNSRGKTTEWIAAKLGVPINEIKKYYEKN